MSEVNAKFDGKKTVTIPSVEGLFFRIDGRDVEAGEHEIGGAVQVSTRAVPGYVLGDSVLKEQYFVVKADAAEKTVVADPEPDADKQKDKVDTAKAADPVVANTAGGDPSSTVRPTNLTGSTPRP